MRGDLADQVLDRKKNPDWQGVRTKMLRSLPTNAKLWEQYAEVRANSLREHGNMSAPTVLFVLEALLARGLPAKTLLTAFGPGFTCAGLLLERAA